MSDIRGICPIIAMPFTETGEVDYSSMRNLLRILTKGGCHGLTLFGIGGEYYKLSDEERRQLIKIVVEECKKGDVPSIVSITQHATEVAVQEARHAEEAGADVSGLLAKLTVGGEHLAEARVWFSLGDFDSASLLAGLCYDVAEEVRFEAEELRSEVYGFQVVSVFVKVSGSVVGVVVVLALGTVIWFYLFRTPA